MQCPRCLNQDNTLFYKGSNGYYCRACISFQKAMIEEEQSPITFSKPIVYHGYHIPYALTKQQKEISRKCCQLSFQTNVLLDCVCGAGKTEIIIETIGAHLAVKHHVGIAIPRRQVVLELTDRLRQIFTRQKVVAVCGGHTDELFGDLIVCTTHQLFRYYQYFDLLIVDEPDAFPFRNNRVLEGISQTATKQFYVYLTATPSKSQLNLAQMGKLYHLKLTKRPHGYPLPCPLVKRGPILLQCLYLLIWIWQQRQHPRMIFLPKIKQVQWLRWLTRVWSNVFAIYSGSDDRDETIEIFRQNLHAIIFTTTILERGVTIPNVSVCIWGSDHSVFDEASLIQIAGRVGRSFQFPEGSVLFLAKHMTKAMRACIKKIEEANQCDV